MRILFVGVLDISWSTNCAMRRVLEKFGHDVEAFNYRTIASRYKPRRWYSSKRLNIYLDKAASFLRRNSYIPLGSGWYFSRNGRGKMNELLVEAVREKNFDLILMSKTDTIDYRVIEETRCYAPTWYFFMDPMEQAVRINAKEYAVRAKWSSATFSDVAESFRKAGANAYWITQGLDTEVFKPNKVPNKVYDVVFVGARDAKRSHYINALRKASVSVTCFGQGWENAPVYQQQLVDIYNKSRIVLNFCRPGGGFSIRVFQAMGTGSFVLSEHCHDLEYLFKNGEELYWFHNKGEMAEKVHQYLANDALRERIAKNGNIVAYKNHSWESVMQKILKIAFPYKQMVVNNLS